MNTKLKPTECELYLIYQCPNCPIQHTVTIKETRFPGGVFCPCGTKIKFQKIKDADVKLNYIEEPLNKERICLKDNKLNELVQTLVGIGHKKSKAQMIAGKVMFANPNSSIELLLREALSIQ